MCLVKNFLSKFPICVLGLASIIIGGTFLALSASVTQAATCVKRNDLTWDAQAGSAAASFSSCRSCIYTSTKYWCSKRGQATVSNSSSSGTTTTNETLIHISEPRAIQPIQYPTISAAQSYYQKALTHDNAGLYVAVRADVSNYYTRRDCSRDTGSRILNALGIDTDGTFTVLAKFTGDTVGTEFIPVLSVNRTGIRCESKSILNRLITPFIKLADGGSLNVTIQIRQKQTLRLTVFSRMMRWISGVRSGRPAFRELTRNERAEPSPKGVKLTEQDYQRLKPQVDALDAAVADIFGQALNIDGQTEYKLAIEPEVSAGFVLRIPDTPRKKKFALKFDTREASIRFTIEPRMSIFMAMKRQGRLVFCNGTCSTAISGEGEIVPAKELYGVIVTPLRTRTQFALPYFKRRKNAAETEAVFFDIGRKRAATVYEKKRTEHTLRTIYTTLTSLRLATGTAASTRDAQWNTACEQFAQNLGPRLGLHQKDVTYLIWKEHSAIFKRDANRRLSTIGCGGFGGDWSDIASMGLETMRPIETASLAPQPPN